MSNWPIDREHWSRVAREWIKWARLPGHDAFWAYRESLVDFVGPGDGAALDIGCGEGRVSREMKSLGYRVTALDPVAELVKAAVEVDSAHAYAVADATALPFTDSRFEIVVAYNVLMDLDDVPTTLREVRRVLQPSGQLVISIVHPFSDRGTFSSTAPDSPFVLRGTYFGRQRFDGTEERNGLRMHFAGWSQPLETYASALEGAGLAITSLREPIPDHVHGREYLRRWMRVPLFLWLKARRL
jgi:2-polyprenyl-3-methyl-5-hydroxy-6-metoxy-1,4-benzoquinol methylase